MLDCKKVLDGAKDELHILDIRDMDPEKIQSHLGGCMVRATTFSISLIHKPFICDWVSLGSYLFMQPQNVHLILTHRFLFYYRNFTSC